MQLLKITEVADRLGVSRRTVERLLDEGTLRYVPIGPTDSRTRQHRRIREDDLAAFIESRTTAPAATA